MTLKIKYFGMASEASGKEEEELSVHFSSLHELKKELISQYPNLSKINFKIAVNQEFVDEDYQLIGNEEIALLPPFAGG